MKNMNFKEIKDYLLNECGDSHMLHHAKYELDLLCKNSTDEYDKQISECLLLTIALINKFGHSGGSMSDFKSILNQLLSFKTLTPLTFSEEEWAEPYTTDGKQQNKRCSSFFKDSDGKINYIDDYIVSEDFILRYGEDTFEKGYGSGWHCRPIITENGEVTNNKVGRRTLKDITNYTTKTFKLKGVSIEYPKDYWTFFVDSKELTPLIEFYDIELEDVDVNEDLPLPIEKVNEILQKCKY